MLISSSCLTPGRVQGLWNSVFQLVIIANIWSPLRYDISSPCSKSPHAHITGRPRKHESETRVLIWRRTRFVRGRLITKILHLSERVIHLHIAVPTKTRFYASRIHVLKSSKNICIEEKVIIWLTFDPGWTFTGFPNNPALFSTS